MEQGIVQVYYGEGKGKTSAALGNAIRRASAGAGVYLITFLKGQLNSDFLSRLEPEVKCFRFERSYCAYSELNDEEKTEERANIVNGLNFAKKALSTGECDILILDEILGAIVEGVVAEEDVVDIIKARSPLTTVILTGRVLPDAIREAADQVLNIVPEKEPEAPPV